MDSKRYIKKMWCIEILNQPIFYCIMVYNNTIITGIAKISDFGFARVVDDMEG